jgi:hypothetical protein
MKAYLLSVVVVLTAVMTGLLTGCESDTSYSDSPEGPDISGEWSGTYDRPGYSEPVSAKITQHEDMIVIETSKSGLAELFTGRITQSGDVEVMDNETGKTWTSLGATTPNHVFIRDYLDVGASEAVQSITLYR